MNVSVRGKMCLKWLPEHDGFIVFKNSYIIPFTSPLTDATIPPTTLLLISDIQVLSMTLLSRK